MVGLVNFRFGWAVEHSLYWKIAPGIRSDLFLFCRAFRFLLLDLHRLMLLLLGQVKGKVLDGVHRSLQIKRVNDRGPSFKSWQGMRSWERSLNVWERIIVLKSYLFIHRRQRSQKGRHDELVHVLSGWHGSHFRLWVGRRGSGRRHARLLHCGWLCSLWNEVGCFAFTSKSVKGPLLSVLLTLLLCRHRVVGHYFEILSRFPTEIESDFWIWIG